MHAAALPPVLAVSSRWPFAGVAAAGATAAPLDNLTSQMDDPSVASAVDVGCQQARGLRERLLNEALLTGGPAWARNAMSLCPMIDLNKVEFGEVGAAAAEEGACGV